MIGSGENKKSLLRKKKSKEKGGSFGLANENAGIFSFLHQIIKSGQKEFETFRRQSIIS
jgi:hypothetical protein